MKESRSVRIIDIVFFFSSRRRHTRYWRDWSSDVCSSDLQRDDGLARSDLPLQQPVHGLLAGQLGGQLLPHLPLALGEREGQRGVDGGQQAAGPPGAGDARLQRDRKGVV